MEDPEDPKHEVKYKELRSWNQSEHTICRLGTQLERARRMNQMTGVFFHFQQEN